MSELLQRPSPVALVPADEEDAAFGDLPELLVEIADVAGIEAALTLADRYGGNRVYIPRTAGPHHWLTLCVGEHAAHLLCEHFGSPSGIELELPRGPVMNRAQRQARVQRLIAQGLNSTEITRRTGCTRRTVKRNRAALRRMIDGTQLDMFEAGTAMPSLPKPDQRSEP
ncbi:MAG: hypothetical protein KDJ37_08760 [Hyphomicrobiaceae bacterium]|nr:hypothetical protein [Hyphomicrobiaceae bacterium]